MEQTRFADGLDVVYKRIREVKNNSNDLGLNQMGKQKCHMLSYGIQGDRHVLKSRTVLAMQPDMQMKMMKRQLDSTTTEFQEKSSSSSVFSSFPYPRRWIMVSL